VACFEFGSGLFWFATGPFWITLGVSTGVATMNNAYGIFAVCVAILMIWVARPSDGVSIPLFKKVWVVGQLYIMATMVVFVIGAALIIM
jgi:hypothetical protein